MAAPKQSSLNGLVNVSGSDEVRSIVYFAWALAVLAVVVRLYYWWYTQRTWEDALIAYRHVTHAAQGFGLNYGFDPAAPVQGFTSPLGVLIPLAAELLQGGWGLLFLKSISILSAAATVLLLGALAIHPVVRLSAPLAFAVMGYAAIEHHQILSGVGGMETQMATLAWLMAVYALVADRPRLLGLSLGLGLLVRPDMALWALVAGGWLALRGGKGLLQAVGIASLIYLPWLIFATVYYGSPIPNSLLAKRLNVPHWYEMIGHPSWRTYLRYGAEVLRQDLLTGLAPAYAGHGTNPYLFAGSLGHGLLAGGLFGCDIAGVAMAFARRSAFRPVALGLVVYLAYYLLLVPVITFWYRATFSVLLLLCAVYGVQALFGAFDSRRGVRFLLWVAAAAYVFCFAAVLPKTFYADRQIQRLVDDGVRRSAGLYLRDVMQPFDKLVCEPIGYVGYYSHAGIEDWPGIGSRAVTEFSREHRRTLEDLLHHFKPEYTLLRPADLDCFNDPAWFEKNYQEISHFAVDSRDLPALPWNNYCVDKEYRIYRKRME